MSNRPSADTGHRWEVMHHSAQDLSGNGSFFEISPRMCHQMELSARPSEQRACLGKVLGQGCLCFCRCEMDPLSAAVILGDEHRSVP